MNTTAITTPDVPLGGRHPGEPEVAGSEGAETLSISIDAVGLAAARNAVASAAHLNGLERSAIDRFVLAVNEIMTNVIAHGGGQGRLRLWPDDGWLRCRVTDEGPGMPSGFRAPTLPPILSTGGRGLWLAYQLCHLDIRSGEHGTTVDLSTPMSDVAVSDVAVSGVAVSGVAMADASVSLAAS